MSDQSIENLPIFAGMLLAAVGLFLELWWRGLLSANAIARKPMRDVSLGASALLGAFFLYFISRMFAGLAAKEFGLVHDPEVPVFDWPHLVLAKFVMFTTLIWGLLVVMYAISAPIAHGDDPRGLGLLPSLSNLPLQVMAVVIAFIVLMPTYLALNMGMVMFGELIGAGVPETGHELLAIITKSEDRQAVALLIVSAVIFAPLFEELLFRVILQTCMINALISFVIQHRTKIDAGNAAEPLAVIPYGAIRWVGVIFTSLLFASVHYGATPWQALPSLFIVGVALGYVYERTGNLWPCVALHAIFNMTNVALSILLVKETAT